MTSSLLDAALDVSVVGGYTNVGYRIRSRGWDALPRMEGKVRLITGATSGLGLAAADGYAGLGATVWLAVRNRERGERARGSTLKHRSEADVRVEPEQSGGFWHDRRRRPIHLLPGTRETAAERRRLWAGCEVLSSTLSTERS